MSTTVVRQRTTRFPGKAIGMALAGLAVAAVIGFGIANIDDTSQQTGVVSSEVDRADQTFLDQAGARATERHHLLDQATKLTGSPAAPGVGEIVVPEIEFGGMAAPTWQPNLPELDMGGVNNTEPFGYPNYGRLDTYLGSEPASGPR